MNVMTFSNIQKYIEELYSIYHTDNHEPNADEMTRWAFSSPKSLISLLLVSFVSEHIRNLGDVEFKNILDECSCNANSISQILKNFSHHRLIIKRFESCNPNLDFLRTFITHCNIIMNIHDVINSDSIKETIH